MSQTMFNKLVRDKIPENIEKNGEIPIIHIADNPEFWQKLKEKLKEEVDEFLSEENEEELKEELADIQEVINSILKFKKFDKETIDRIRKVKLEKNGGFEKRIILDRTE